MTQRVELEAAERAKIEAELALLQGKVMHGGEHIKDRVVRRQRELEEQEREIAAQQEREVQLRQEAQRKQEARLGMEEQYTSLQEEVEVKSRKLKQLWAKFRAAQVCHCSDPAYITRPTCPHPKSPASPSPRSPTSRTSSSRRRRTSSTPSASSRVSCSCR